MRLNLKYRQSISSLFVFVIFFILFADIANATIIRPFTTRFETNTNGRIYLVGNVNVHEGSEVPGNNNNYAMLNVDVDAIATTFNSSQANFDLPSGAEVLWAGLYWGADTEGNTATNPPDISSRDRVLFSTGGGYQTIISQIPVDQNTGGYRYQAFSEVTNLIRQQLQGTTRTYTTANIQAVTGTGPSHYAGWTLVVAIRDPALVQRHLHIFDGFVQIDSPSTPNTTTVTGFRTPLAGTFNTEVGMVAYEGDLTSTGDYFQVNGFILSDILNPIDNFFNSSITREGVRISNKTPDFINQLGFDIDTVDVPYALGIINNGDTSANLTFNMVGDWYYPGVLTFAIDVYDPVLDGNITKSMVDLNGGALYGDDEIEFTINIGNTGNDNATNVILTDPIPANTTFVPGSLNISMGPNTGSMTDASGDDQAEFDSGNNRVIFRLGTGANATNGGILNINQWTEVKFRVKVNSTVSPGTSIQNVATVDFIGETSTLPYTASSNVLQAIAEEFVDLSLTKTSDAPTYFEGDTATFTLTLSNAGPDTADNTVVSDLLPAGLLFQNAVASQGSYAAGTGLWTVGSMANGASATLTLTTTIDTGAAAFTQPITNNASVTADQVDTDLTNNDASANITALLPSDLSTSTKTVDDLNGGDIEFGDVLRYTITLIETGGGTATGVQVIDDIPTNVANFNIGSSPTGSTFTYTAGGGTNLNGLLDVSNITVPGVSNNIEITFTVVVSGPNGNTIDNSATIIHPGHPDTIAAAQPLLIAGYSLPVSGDKLLYLDADLSLSRTPSTLDRWAGFVYLPPSTTTTWTLTPPLRKAVTLGKDAMPTTIPVQLWLSSSRNQNYDIPVTLRCGAAIVASSTETKYLNRWATNGPFTWNLPLATDFTCPVGSSFELDITNTETKTNRDMYVFQFTSPDNSYSYVSLPSKSVINVDSITFHAADYPTDSPITQATDGDTVRIRAVISDPFGDYDITETYLDLTDGNGAAIITNQLLSPLYEVTEVPDDPATKTFEYTYTLPPNSATGFWNATVTSNEGTEGTVSDNGLASFEIPAALPSITILKSSDRATVNPGEVITYTITTMNSGAGPATTVMVSDNLSPYVGMILDYDGVTPPYEPFDFVPATSGLTFGTPVYYDAGGIFTPDFAAGEDNTVIRWEIPMNGSFNPGPGSEFTLRFKVRVK